ncbi:hypothetical protein BKA70DRAFT_483121 [Coprinopsis sp. MPI-PUGE-AT-0042]|nr:hypothetical protein BKA70DRAFT_483121 [Coprinopsis sp. MPI-PUGE-AT-0042]
MPDEQQTPPGVVLFDRTAGQNFDNSHLSAAGRDQINVSINLATGSAGHQHPSLVVQGSRPPTQRHSLLSRVHRRSHTRSRRQSRSGTRPLQESVNATQCLAQVAPEHPTPGPPPSSPSSDVDILADGSSIASLDSRSQSSLVRLHASNAEEVYERSLLPKGHGFPLFNPRPLERPVRFGDFGILGQDGFDSFGNLFDPKDQQEFSIDRPPQPNLKHQPEKLHEGLVISAGVGDVRRLADADTKATNRLELHCREPLGAALVLTSSGDLETLTTTSGNQLREYLRRHGTQLIIRLRQKYYLQPGQSLYVVTGTIKSDSWAIAVHTSPMREGYDQMVLTRREGMLGAPFPTHEWTRLGSADARCEASKVIDADGRRIKDQCLFLRGFLLTPSLDLGQQRKTSTSTDSPGGDSSSSPDATDSEKGDDKGRKGGSANSGQHKSLEPNHHGTSSEGSLQHQLQGIFQLVSLVQPFPATTSDLKSYYPSRRINDTLLEGENENLAITHDDDWMASLKIRDNYLDDEALSTLVVDFWGKRLPICSQGVATTIPIVGRVEVCQQNNSPSLAPIAEGTPVSTLRLNTTGSVKTANKIENPQRILKSSRNRHYVLPRGANVASQITKRPSKASYNGNKKFPGWVPEAMKSGIRSGWGRRISEKVEQSQKWGVLSFGSEGSSSNSPSALEEFSEQSVQILDRTIMEKHPKSSHRGKNADHSRRRPPPRVPPNSLLTLPPPIFQAESHIALHGHQPIYTFDKDMGSRSSSMEFEPSLLHVPGNLVTWGPPSASGSSTISNSSWASTSPIQEQTFHQGSEVADEMWQYNATDEPQSSYSSYPDLANNPMQSNSLPYSWSTWNLGNDVHSEAHGPEFNPQADPYGMTSNMNAALNMDFADLGSSSGQALSYFQTKSGSDTSVSHDESNAMSISSQALLMRGFAAMPGEHTPPNNQYEAYDFNGYSSVGPGPGF